MDVCVYVAAYRTHPPAWHAQSPAPSSSHTHTLSVYKNRIVVGKSYYEPYGTLPEAAVEACLALILSNKMTRHNEGMLGTAEFPVNYFTVSEMEQWFGEDFAAQFQ